MIYYLSYSLGRIKMNKESLIKFVQDNLITIKSYGVISLALFGWLYYQGIWVLICQNQDCQD